MIIDFSVFIILLAVFVVGAAFMFYGLFQCAWITSDGLGEQEWAGVHGPLLVPIWAIFGSWN